MARKETIRHLRANLRQVNPVFFSVAEICADKVDRIVKHLQYGGCIPPVVVVLYGQTMMPIDGHHRLAAARKMNRAISAWVISGREFDKLDVRCRELDACRAEDHILCGGVPAKLVAEVDQRG